MNRCDCDDEWFSSTEGGAGEVAMALEDAIEKSHMNV